MHNESQVKALFVSAIAGDEVILTHNIDVGTEHRFDI